MSPPRHTRFVQRPGWHWGRSDSMAPARVPAPRPLLHTCPLTGSLGAAAGSLLRLLPPAEIVWPKLVSTVPKEVFPLKCLRSCPRTWFLSSKKIDLFVCSKMRKSESDPHHLSASSCSFGLIVRESTGLLCSDWQIRQFSPPKYSWDCLGLLYFVF